MSGDGKIFMPKETISREQSAIVFRNLLRLR